MGKDPSSAEPRPSRRREVFVHGVLAVLSLGLVSLAFHPTDWWVLGWVGFVPWMTWHAARPRRGTIPALMAAYYLHFAWVLWWVGEISPPLVWAIPLLGLPFVAALGWSVDRLVHRHRVPPLVAYPLAIVALEVLRDQALGLTWSSVGYTQWRLLPLVQWAAVFRVHGVSLAVLAMNAAIAQALLAGRSGGDGAWRAAPRWRAPAMAALLVAAMIGAGAAAMQATELEEGPLAVGLQPNVPQYEKLRNRSARARLLFWVLHARNGVAARDPDLLVLPETSIGRWRDDEESFAAFLERPITSGSRANLADILPRGRGQLSVLGYGKYRRLGEGDAVIDEDDDGYQEWNVAGVVRDGHKLLGEYAKRKIVPFGEFVPWPQGWPFREWLKDLIRETGGYLPDLTAGEETLVVPLETGRGSYRFGLNICYETVFPEFFTDPVSEGADFIVNVSNDAWYRESSELDLVHVAVTFRAVECRRSIFRVSNTGISALIDPLGREVGVVEEDGDRKAVAGVLIERIPICRATTPVASLGDLPALGFSLIWLLLHLLRGRRGARAAARRDEA